MYRNRNSGMRRRNTYTKMHECMHQQITANTTTVHHNMIEQDYTFEYTITNLNKDKFISGNTSRRSLRSKARKQCNDNLQTSFVKISLGIVDSNHTSELTRQTVDASTDRLSQTGKQKRITKSKQTLWHTIRKQSGQRNWHLHMQTIILQYEITIQDFRIRQKGQTIVLKDTKCTGYK